MIDRWYTVSMLHPGGPRHAFYAWVWASGKAAAREAATEAYGGRYRAAEYSGGVVRQDVEPRDGDAIVRAA